MADVRKKAWRKPEVRILEAGAAENQNNPTGSDGATTGPKRS
jgi:hypothetical protein